MKRLRVYFVTMTFSLVMGIPLLIFAAAEEKLKTSAEKSIERRQKVELMGFFAKNPNQSQLPKTAFAIELYNKAVQYFEKQEYDLARQAVQESLAQNDENGFAYELLGEIEYLQQNMKEAKANYEIAYALNPSQDLKEKIEKVTQETKVESKLTSYNVEHFIIKYHDSDRNVEGYEFRELLRTTYLRLSQDFSYYFKHSIVVLLYQNEDFKKLTNMPHWVTGVYDGKVRMPMTKGGYIDQDLAALTAHEVTHAFVAGMSKGKAPAWINEGIAEFEEGKVRPNDDTVFKAARRTKTLMTLDELMSFGGASENASSTKVTLFYEQSCNLVSYIIQRYSMFHIKQILEQFGKGKNSDAAIREVLKISPQKLEMEWKDTF